MRNLNPALEDCGLVLASKPADHMRSVSLHTWNVAPATVAKHLATCLHMHGILKVRPSALLVAPLLHEYLGVQMEPSRLPEHCLLLVVLLLLPDAALLGHQYHCQVQPVVLVLFAQVRGCLVDLWRAGVMQKSGPLRPQAQHDPAWRAQAHAEQLLRLGVLSQDQLLLGLSHPPWKTAEVVWVPT